MDGLIKRFGAPLLSVLICGVSLAGEKEELLARGKAAWARRQGQRALWVE
jgi:hypothetical protein